jgi:hypothetical protein
MTRRSADFESKQKGAGVPKSERYSMPENPTEELLGHSCRHRK